MVRYSVLRLLIFFGCLGLLWLLGLRSRDEQLVLLLGSALLSLLISYFALRPLREQYSRELAERLERRRAVRAAVNDEQAEDAEDVDDEGRADYR
jgi:type II secretory pathway component PulM